MTQTISEQLPEAERFQLAAVFDLVDPVTGPEAEAPARAVVVHGKAPAEASGSPTAVGRLAAQLGLALTRAGRPREGLRHVDRALTLREACTDEQLHWLLLERALVLELLGRTAEAMEVIWSVLDLVLPLSPEAFPQRDVFVAQGSALVTRLNQG